MKTTIFLILLFAGVLYSQDGQPDRLIRRTEASSMIADSLAPVKASIESKLNLTLNNLGVTAISDWTNSQGSYTTTIRFDNFFPTANRFIDFPNASGIILLNSDTTSLLATQYDLSQVGSVISDSLNPVRTSIATKLNTTQLTDTLNANVRGYQTLPQVKAVVSDSISKILNKDFVTPEQFGAIADDATDDATYFQQAVNTGLPVVLKQGTYIVNSTITYVGDVNIIGSNTVIENNSNNKTFSFNSVASVPTLVTSLADTSKINEQFIKVSSATGIDPTYMIELVDTALWYYDNRGSLTKGEIHAVERISNDTIYLKDRVYDNYLLYGGVTVNFYPRASYYVSGITINHLRNSPVTSTLNLVHGYNSVIEDVTINNASIAAIGTVSCVNTVLDKINVYGSNEVATGYGISISASHETKVTNSHFSNCRRGVDFSGMYPSRNGTVLNCSADGGGLAQNGTDLNIESSGFGTHGTAENIAILFNRMTNMSIGVVSRGANTTIQGNQFIGGFKFGINLAMGANFIIKDNVAYPMFPDRTLDSTMTDNMMGQFIYLSELTSDNSYTTEITGNNVTLSSSFLNLHKNLKGAMITNNIHNFYNTNHGKTTAYFISANTDTLSNTIYDNNLINILSGTLGGEISGGVIEASEFETLSYSINVPDTVTTGTIALWKMPNDITIIEIAACTDAATTTFNIEERGEITPNSVGTDVMGSDLVADTNQEETSTFTNATISKNNWLALTVSATGDVTLLSITIRYIKTD